MHTCKLELSGFVFKTKKGGSSWRSHFGQWIMRVPYNFNLLYMVLVQSYRAWVAEDQVSRILAHNVQALISQTRKLIHHMFIHCFLLYFWLFHYRSSSNCWDKSEWWCHNLTTYNSLSPHNYFGEECQRHREKLVTIQHDIHVHVKCANGFSS